MGCFPSQPSENIVKVSPARCVLVRWVAVAIFSTLNRPYHWWWCFQMDLTTLFARVTPRTVCHRASVAATIFFPCGGRVQICPGLYNRFRKRPRQHYETAPGTNTSRVGEVQHCCPCRIMPARHCSLLLSFVHLHWLVRTEYLLHETPLNDCRCLPVEQR